MTVEILVQGCKVTIAVGGQPAPAAKATGTITKKGSVGGGATEPTSSGGAGAPVSGTLVIGPIVIGCAPYGQPSGTAGGGAVEGTSSGGDGATEPTSSGGGGGATSGVLVIGPIVVGGYGGGSISTGTTATSQAISVPPGEDE